MGWEEKKALNRIFNTFKRIKNGIYQEDIDALKTLNESNELNSKQNVKDNLIFAKLYCIALRQNLDYYGSIKMAIKGINKQLGLPLNFQIEQLTNDLNHKDFCNYLKESGFSLELASNNDEMVLNNQKELYEKLSKSWDLKKVEESFYKSANEVLKDINNYA